MSLLFVFIAAKENVKKEKEIRLVHNDKAYPDVKLDQVVFSKSDVHVFLLMLDTGNYDFAVQHCLSLWSWTKLLHFGNSKGHVFSEKLSYAV